jgi:L-seryl-tRNA(Ser) seleniumtransferase
MGAGDQIMSGRGGSQADSENAAGDNSLRRLPSVDRLLSTVIAVDLGVQYGRALLVEALRAVLEQRRLALRAGRDIKADGPMNATLLQEAREWLEELIAPTLQPVINATGVILHTNLGRAPLSEGALTAVQTIATGYTNLEYDLLAGERGSRTVHAEQFLTRLVGTEAALVVNNNAAAVLLLLTALCQGREVLISRGQLVEIGGGFRVPDVMVQSGARLVEVGTTNRTHLRDYAAAINENTAAILVAHHSNFKMVGFTSEPSLAELGELARQRQILLLYDQGSGALVDPTAYGLAAEALVSAGVQAGVDVIAFSGDKLLGGPQAGILCGRADLIGRLKRHPLARAVRADKLCLAALAATLIPYLTGQVVSEIPIWRMIARPLREIEAEADTWAARLQELGVTAAVIDGESTIGGGSLPGATLPTKLVAISQAAVDSLAAALRRHRPPVIARIADGRLLIDPRTVLAGQSQELLQAVVHYARAGR